MSSQATNSGATFRVLDVMTAPDGGKILRLRLQGGDAPSIREMKGARMRARSPDGEVERTFRVTGFALQGGRPSDRRVARTGRVDVHISVEDGDAPPAIGLRWEVSGPLS